MRHHYACCRPWFGIVALYALLPTAAIDAEDVTLGQGIIVGEVTSSSALLQTRLTLGNELNDRGDLDGAAGIVRFELATDAEFTDQIQTPDLAVRADSDFIARAMVEQLQPATRYFYRAVYGRLKADRRTSSVGSFRTLPGKSSSDSVSFIVGSCMNYNKFMHGKRGNAGPVVTATDDDKRLGFPAFATMTDLKPDFFVGTGDIVYYDNPYRRSETLEELRLCWHEQFRFPRMVEFFRNVPTYWSKDDHDFRFNDSDNTSQRLPLPTTGIALFREQLPITPAGDTSSPTYRTHRVNKHLQIWLTEGRDFRSANGDPDGPNKTLWGDEQKRWLKETLAESDATWKVLISPTPMVGPDDAKKTDNHANLGGFRHEADEFFAWLDEAGIDNFVTICGDRHWQYHSIHPSGVHEFACGALNDENARLGVSPGARRGTDPEALIKQPFTSPTPSGGFLMVEVDERLAMTFYTDDGDRLYKFAIPRSDESASEEN